MKTTYTVWESDPAILYSEFPSGAMQAFMLTAGGEWIEAHPADIACKAGMITKAMFDDMTAGNPPPSPTRI